MYNGIGLTTARGSGTNGYVQKNMAFIRDRANTKPMSYAEIQRSAPVQREPNKEILEFEERRRIEVKVTEWAEQNGFLDDPK
jgi:serine/arginine repetitive matrix protein 2